MPEEFNNTPSSETKQCDACFVSALGVCDLSCKGWACKVLNEDKFVCSASLIL